MTQSQALEILKSGQNVFLTGCAGTGKTFLLNQFIEYLRKKEIQVEVTASTGIAATHLGGITIHSWSGMGIDSNLSDAKIRQLVKKNRLGTRIKKAKILIIDEISMFDAERLDLLDRICKAVKDPFLIFGGLQIVMCGDFFQLPPVDSKNKGVKFAYDSLAWKQAKLKICYLKKQYRQDDTAFINILNSIRENKANEDTLNRLKTRLNQRVKGQIKLTKLYTHNVNVDAINDYELSRISGKEQSYYMISKGPQKLVDFLKKNCLAPEVLKLKKRAIVMFVKNNFNKGYVNGTLGKVIDFDENDWPVIKTKSGKKITAVPTSWIIERDERVIASVEQIPLRLAWAITVHKSQGMSLDAAEIDLSNAFECGMGYVALSRVRRLNSVKLIGINQMALRVNQQIVEKDKEFKNL